MLAADTDMWGKGKDVTLGTTAFKEWVEEALLRQHSETWEEKDSVVSDSPDDSLFRLEGRKGIEVGRK